MSTFRDAESNRPQHPLSDVNEQLRQMRNGLTVAIGRTLLARRHIVAGNNLATALADLATIEAALRRMTIDVTRIEDVLAGSDHASRPWRR